MAIKLRAERVPINRDGYDRRGRYWGTGSPLYRVTSEDDRIDEHVRATSAVDARQKVRIQHGLAEAPMSEGRRLASRLLHRIRNEIHAPTTGMQREVVTKLIRDAETLAKRLRPNNPGDRAWMIYDNDIAKAKDRVDPTWGRPRSTDLEYALYNVRSAVQMIEGATSRAGGAQRDRRVRRPRAARP